MPNEMMIEMYRLVEKAKMYEKVGKEDDALKIYLEIHERYFPNTTHLFDRPAVILEKTKRYDEAKSICEKAIKLISENRVTGTVDHFQKKLDRINEKLELERPQPVSQSAGKGFLSFLFKPKEEKREKGEDFERNFRNHPKSSSEEIVQKNTIPSHSSDHYETPKRDSEESEISCEPSQNAQTDNIKRLAIVIALISAFVFATFYLSNQNNSGDEYFKDMYVDLSKMFSEERFDNSNKLIFEDKVDSNLPKVTASMVDKAVKKLNKEPGVIKSYVIVASDTLGLAIKADPLITQADAESIGEKFTKYLSQSAAEEDNLFLTENKNDFGKIYTYYNAYVSVQAGDNIMISEGIIVKNSSNLYWKKTKDESKETPRHADSPNNQK